MRRRVLQMYNRVRRYLRRRGAADGPPPLREIRVNHPYYDEDGEVADGPWFCDNAVATAKYNVVSFIPRSLFEQFRRLANLYFLCMSVLMLIGTYTTQFDSPLTPWSTLLPLIIVLAVTMAKEGAEDIKRHRSDALVNSRKCRRLRHDGTGALEEVIWKNIRAGDIIQILDREEIPADVVLLTSSEQNGVAFVETSNIDGETNLKIKQSARTDKAGPKWTSPTQLDGWKGTVQCDLPNAAIHFFHGAVAFDDQEVSVDQSNLLLRGSTLRNTRWALGVVVYTGRETKIVMNSREAPSKLSTVERTINSLIYLIFVAQLVISAITLMAFLIFKDLHYDALYYVCYDYSDSDVPMFRDNCDSNDSYTDAAYFLTFFILYNNFIPISLYVTVEMVNYVQAFYIDQDKDMYDDTSDTPALARTSNMNADLGQIAFVFSDKTGTLTQNVMRFKRCSIAGQLYGSPLTSGVDSPTAQHSPQEPSVPLEQLAFEAARDFEALSAQSLFMLINSVCHTVQLDSESGELQAESPDEEALVRAASELGFRFHGRAPGQVTVHINNKFETFEILAVIPFDSERKRMTTVVRRLGHDGKPVGDVLALVKGADNIILERSSSYVQGHSYEQLTTHLDVFAADGLRTLVLAVRRLALDEYEEWADAWRQAELAVVDREAELARVAAEIERDLCVVGATAIEDRLQDEVPGTIADMHRAGIKLWVLTGDKMETAINIGYSCRLLRKDMVLMKLKHSATHGPGSVNKQLRKLYDHFSRVTEDPHLIERVWSNVKSAVAQAAEKLQLKREQSSQLQSANLDIISDERNTMSESLLEEHEHVPLIEKPPHLPELSQLSSRHLALIVDGPTLNDILGDRENERLFLTISKLCNAVLACRVSPAQKRMLVRLVKRGVSPKPITLAIGDGANDVGMIQEAQIGVGISGKEGRQAVNNSDFAIAQFRFLKNLLLVHGRWDYRRICKVVLYSFYKNIVLTFILFAFTFMSAFSGQSLFEDYVYAGYNFFLFLPVFAFGIFDQDVRAEFVLKHPVVYVSGLEYMDMNLRLMGQYLAQAVIDSILIFFIPYAAFFGVGGAWSKNGDAHDLYVFGTTVYTVLFISMLLKAGNLTYNWNKWTVACWVFSILLYFMFLLAYERMIAVAYNFHGVATEMLNTPVFWLLVLLVPTLTWMLDLLVMTIKNQYFPTIVDVGVEKDRGFGPADGFPHRDNSTGEPSKAAKQFNLDFGSIQALNERMTETERQELGIKDTTLERLDSSFSYDHVSQVYGPGAGSRFRRPIRRLTGPGATAAHAPAIVETKGDNNDD